MTKNDEYSEQDFFDDLAAFHDGDLRTNPRPKNTASTSFCLHSAHQLSRVPPDRRSAFCVAYACRAFCGQALHAHANELYTPFQNVMRYFCVGCGYGGEFHPFTVFLFAKHQDNWREEEVARLFPGVFRRHVRILCDFVVANTPRERAELFFRSLCMDHDVIGNISGGDYWGVKYITSNTLKILIEEIRATAVTPHGT